jgi:two-component system sensor histidine kinase KdpD
MSTCELTCPADTRLLRVGQVADARSQDRVTLTGVIRGMQNIAVDRSLAYRYVLADGTGEIDVLVLGRAAAAALAKGTRCTVQGTSGRLAVWNPGYRVLSAAGLPQARPPAPPAAGQAAEPAGPDLGAAATSSNDTPAGSVPDAATVAPGAAAAGHLHIYLAAAAGAGKTIAMLDEGQRLRVQGADVVIGVLQDHGRLTTQAHAVGLEVVPKRVSDYHGARFEEMDLNAVLRRRPHVALVDELAHTNVPGSGRHDKRWQDVLEVLEAGIDVITTVNIQHLESIAGTVEDISQVRVRERVPDWVVRRADQIELVDASPGQLRYRMLHGDIYPADQVPQALTHFFRADNLTALRDLALRFLAGEPGEELRGHPARVSGETTERIMAGVTATPGAEAIVRRAARIAARSKADLDIVHIVISPHTGGRGRGDILDRLKQVVYDVGATWHQLDADDPVSALIEFATSEHVTEIVVGSSQCSRWRELIGGGSAVTRVSRLATRAGIDVHIVARREMTAA